MSSEYGREHRFPIMTPDSFRSRQSPLSFDLGEKNLVRMNLNENIVFPKNVMRSILAKCTDEYDPRVYPPAIDEGESLILNQEIAKYCGCSSSSVAIGVGGDQLIDLLFRMILPKPNDTTIIVSPTFPIYSDFASRQGKKVKDFWLNPSSSEDPYSLPVARLKEIWKKPSNAKLLVIVSPNNPTGIQYPIDQIIEVLEATPQEKKVLLDEAYVEYGSYDGAKRLLKSYKNLVVLRTFSKAFALASVRLGYILSSEIDFIQQFSQRFQYPYPVTTLSITMGIELLRRKDVVLEWVEKTKQFRDDLIASLQKLKGIRVLPRSDTNFVLVETKEAKRIANELLANYAIAVKYIPNLGKEKLECLRITVGSAEANRRLLFALRRVL
jgi:histidinol-phosphate aminotransferase